MKTTKLELIKLTASSGMTLTDGKTYGKEIYLGKMKTPTKNVGDNWWSDVL